MSKKSKAVNNGKVTINAAPGSTVNIINGDVTINGDFNPDLSGYQLTIKKRREKILERIEKSVFKVPEFSINPNSLLSGSMNDKMEFMNSINTSCRGSDTICQKRILNAVNTICSYGMEAACIIAKYLQPAEFDNPLYKIVPGEKEKIKNKVHKTASETIAALNKMNIPVCVCIFCYADTLQACKGNIEVKGRAALEYFSTIRNYNELPTISTINSGHLQDGSPVIRFEAFGDTQNTAQAENYFRIAEKNPDVTFTIWTKNPGLYHNIFKKRGYKKPANLLMVLSSEYLNTPDVKKLSYYDKFTPGLFDYLFTVWTVDGAKNAGVKFNCCAPNKENKCYKCGHCYRSGGDRLVNEILKQDAGKKAD